MNILYKIKLNQNFSYICVDRDPNTKQRSKLIEKYGVTHVPTIIVNDSKLIGKNALLWLRNIISDMGLNGPPAVSSRSNKETSGINPRYITEITESPRGYNDDSTENFMSVDNSVDKNRIAYIAEDGNSHRSSGYSIQSQTILPAEIAMELDNSMTKGDSGKPSKSSYKNSGLKKDLFKEQQSKNEYERYKQERDSELKDNRR